MAAVAPRIFVSHLSGVAVFDPTGDQVGRVRDLVVMLRVGRRPPRLLGLVVELSTRRRIFLPMTRVTSIESGQVITTGVLNVRRFEQRPTERLVFGETVVTFTDLGDGRTEMRFQTTTEASAELLGRMQRGLESAFGRLDDHLKETA